jgi:hypothetical protein
LKISIYPIWQTFFLYLPLLPFSDCRFFEKATLIRQCQEQYTAAQTEYSRAQETIKEKTRGLRHMAAEFKKQHARYRRPK